MRTKIPARKPSRIPFTPEGYTQLEQKMAELTQKRKGAIVALRTAREMGDLSENGAYKAARFELSGIDRELRKLTFQKRYAVIVSPSQTQGIVDFGKRITLKDNISEMTVTLVGSYESDPSTGKVSIYSPLGKAMTGKHVGDTVTVHAPAGTRTYIIKHIE